MLGDERGLPSVLRLRVGHGQYGCIGDKSVYRKALQLDSISKLANRVKRTQFEWPCLDVLDHRLLFDICGQDRKSLAAMAQISRPPHLVWLAWPSPRRGW